MSENGDTLHKLEEVLARLGDVHNSAVALVEKMAVLQAEVQLGALDTVLSGLGKAFSSASASAETLGQALHDAEMERNRLKSEAS